MKVDITNCSRCGFNHDQLEFTELDQTQNEWSHWAPCPTNGQPIMMSCTEDYTTCFNEASVDFLKSFGATIGFIALANGTEEAQDSGLSILYQADSAKEDLLALQQVRKALEGLLKHVDASLQPLTDAIKYKDWRVMEGDYCPQRVHEFPTSEFFQHPAKKDHWKEDNTCSYCGSMPPKEVLRLVAEEGWTTEQAIGKPHKMYLNHPSGITKGCYKAYMWHFSEDQQDELKMLSR